MGTKMTCARATWTQICECLSCCVMRALWKHTRQEPIDAPFLNTPHLTPASEFFRLVCFHACVRSIAIAIAVPLGVIGCLITAIAIPLCFCYFNPDKRPAFMQPKEAARYPQSDLASASATATGKSFTPSQSMARGSPGADVYDVRQPKLFLACERTLLHLST